MKWRPSPLGRIILHPDDVESELALLGVEELGPDYVVQAWRAARPKKNTLMTGEWRDYFARYRIPVRHVEIELIANVTGVRIQECWRYYAPWRDRMREKYTPPDVQTRADIQKRKVELHGRGYSVHPPPDPWELATPSYIEKTDRLAIERVRREGVLDDEAKEKKREGMGVLMLARLAKMREKACKRCAGAGGNLDGEGNVVSPCEACGGRGVVE